MTALLETPGGALDVSTLEARQPDVPLVCTRGHSSRDETVTAPCPRLAKWEALCMTCGHIFRRCEEHHVDDVAASVYSNWLSEVDADTRPDQCHLCATCYVPVFIQQYVRIAA